MVNATVENEPVSVELDSGESTTVPTGETWRVTITAGPSAIADDSTGGSWTEATYVEINGVRVAGTKSMGAHNDFQETAAHGSASSSVPFDATVTDGDTIAASGDYGIYVTGFVVDS